MGWTIINLILVVLWPGPITRTLGLVPTGMPVPPKPSCRVKGRQLSPSFQATVAVFLVLRDADEVV